MMKMCAPAKQEVRSLEYTRTITKHILCGCWFYEGATYSDKKVSIISGSGADERHFPDPIVGLPPGTTKVE